MHDSHSLACRGLKFLPTDGSTHLLDRLDITILAASQALLPLHTS